MNRPNPASALCFRMNHSRLVLCLASLITIPAWSQDPVFVHHAPRMNYLFSEEADPAYVLFDDAPLRTRPEREAGLVRLLKSGERVQVLEDTQDTLTIHGVMSHWYRVAVRGAEGWTWGGNMAQRAFGSHANANVKFVSGIDHVTPSDTGRIGYSYRIVALRGGQEIDRITVRSFAWGFEEVMDHGDLGLKGVDDVITLSVPCVGGCGCATGQVVVFWSGGRLHHVADLMGSPDGAYSENVSFIYPADMEGEADVVLRVTSTYEETEQTEGEEGAAATLTRILRKEHLRWDGKALVATGRPVEERRYVLPLE